MYIGVDLGTTGCKVVLFDCAGNIVSQFNKEYKLICRGSFVEQDAEKWWELVCEGIVAVRGDCGPEIRGISVSTQGIAVVPVDAGGRVLSNAISWLDTRALEEKEYFERTVGREYVYRTTGKFVSAEYTLPKLVWLRQNEPELYRAAHKFLLPLDFLNLRLCGRAVCDYTIAGGTMAFDISRKCYDGTLLEAAGVDEKLLPEVACMGEPLGHVLPEVCEMLGISHDCTVYLGGQDQKIAAIGAGIGDTNITVSFGTATAVTKLTRTLPDKVDFSRFRFNEEYYSYEGVVSTSGAALKWAQSAIFAGHTYGELDCLAEEAGGSDGVTFDTDLTSGGTISGITLKTTTGNIVYALFEGVAMRIAEFAADMGGCDSLTVFGGGSKSRIWCKVLADVSSKKVIALSTPETAALGAAILASERTLPCASATHEFLPRSAVKKQ